MSTAIEAPPSMSLEEAIKEYVRIQQRYDELALEKRRVMEILVPAATLTRRETKTVRLANHDRSIVIKAEFGDVVKCDVNALNQVKEMLGDDVFERYFRTEYKPLQRTLKPFLSETTTDELMQTAKAMIVEAITSQPSPPSFTLEQGRVPVI